MHLGQSNREFNSYLDRSAFVLQNMSLNDVSLDLGAKRSSHNTHPSLKGLLHTPHEPSNNRACLQCISAPALHTYRKALKTAVLSVQTERGRAETKNLYSQLR
jgi:hypothetical protein